MHTWQGLGEHDGQEANIVVAQMDWMLEDEVPPVLRA